MSGKGVGKIAFKTSELKNATKDFRGVIVKAEYLENQRFSGKQLHIEIKTDEYDLNQHEWYAPSDKAGTKWAHFIEALEKSGAMKDCVFEGTDEEEAMQNFAKGLLGMSCRFVEYTDLPSLAKNRGTGKYVITAIVPTEYYGKEEVGTMKEETVGAGAEGVEL